MNLPPIVQVENVTYSYPPAKRGGLPFAALKDVSFSVQRGEIFGLLGPNGGGKTTLFKILSTLLVPETGIVQIAGYDVRTNPHDIRHHLGVAFQFPSLDKKLTAAENLWHHGHLYGIRGAALNLRIDLMLKRVNLQDRAHDLVETLSGGMARRVELAKTLLHSPELLLLDEPSTGLDPGARRDLWEQLKALSSRDSVTVLLTTHLMEEAAACGRLALLHHGQIVALGTPDQLTAEIGGDVLTVHSQDPQTLGEEIRGRFQCPATVLDGTVRIERENGHLFIPQLVEAFPGRIQGISLGKPTLEDVFIHRTGHRLEED
ncbi:MAG TPA: ATP-binding cassette domain-containing protein [Acidobacteriota bacterium]|nr:ATP-binding cassette domain-containing protein [Acidobacteriota bacterium]